MTSGGLFISLEGVDGAGKSSHIAPLAQLFRAQGRAVVCTREPGGSALAEKLRHIVLHDSMDALTEALLVFAARRDHLMQVIEPALARAAVVLCDRFTDASFAYQGGGRGLAHGVLQQLERMVQTPDGVGTALRQPHLTLWFDLPVQTAAQRLQATRAPDRFEAENARFFARVAAAYAQRAAAEPQRFVRIDASAAPQMVRAHIIEHLQGRGLLGKL